MATFSVPARRMVVLASATFAVGDLKPSKCFRAVSPGNDQGTLIKLVSGWKFKPGVASVSRCYDTPSWNKHGMKGSISSVPSSLEDVEPSKFLLIGNPGTGKSTILNGLIGKLKFKSGISYGSGLTWKLDIVEDGSHHFMDTPGLSDMQRRQEAAQAITEALSQNGNYKIFFVITLQNGRVKPEDVATMNLVLKAAPITDYGIIINQLPPREHRELSNPKSKGAEQVFGTLFSTMPTGKQSYHIHLAQRDDDLEGLDNALKPLPQDLLHFMVRTPGMVIKKEDVQRVRASEFDDMKEKLGQRIADLEKDKDRLRHEIQAAWDARDEDRRRLEAQLEQMRNAPGQELNLLPLAGAVLLGLALGVPPPFF